VLERLDVSLPWRKRLARAFGDPDRVGRTLANARPTKPHRDAAGISRAEARRRVEKLFDATGLGTIGSRTADEIAARYVDKAVLARGIGARPAHVLSRLLAIAGPPSAALAALRSRDRRYRLAIAKPIDRFEKRLAAMVDRGIAVDVLEFAADFGRRLDYYTGFVFEIRHAAGDRSLVGGGRYDRLVSAIGADGVVPAVGFSIWLDRIGARR
jgi:ATP phosphoribosyltransferase regulatory subunit